MLLHVNDLSTTFVDCIEDILLALGNLLLDDFLHVADLRLGFVETGQVCLQKAQDCLITHVEVSEEVLDPKEDAQEAAVDLFLVISNELDQPVNEQFKVVQVLLRQLQQVLQDLGRGCLLGLVRLNFDAVGLLQLEILSRANLCNLHHTRCAVDKKVEVFFLRLPQIAHLVREETLTWLLGAELEQIIIGKFTKLFEVFDLHVEDFLVAFGLEEVSVDLVEGFQYWLQLVLDDDAVKVVEEEALR